MSRHSLIARVENFVTLFLHMNPNPLPLVEQLPQVHSRYLFSCQLSEMTIVHSYRCIHLFSFFLLFFSALVILKSIVAFEPEPRPVASPQFTPDK